MLGFPLSYGLHHRRLILAPAPTRYFGISPASMPRACARHSSAANSRPSGPAGSKSTNPACTGSTVRCPPAPGWCRVVAAICCNVPSPPDGCARKTCNKGHFCPRHRYNLPPIIRTSPDRAPQHRQCPASAPTTIAHREPFTQVLRSRCARFSRPSTLCTEPDEPALHGSFPKEREKTVFTTSQECGEHEQSGMCKSIISVPGSFKQWVSVLIRGARLRPVHSARRAPRP